MTRSVTVAAIQASFGADITDNLSKVEGLVQKAAGMGAQIILPPELFQGQYFCVMQDEKWFATAFPWAEHPCTIAMQTLAKDLGVVIPTSIFERVGPNFYNSVVVIDSDGEALGVYRKSHIPDGPGYQEKFYFRPGDTGYKVWDTAFGRIGVGICWDQWFPECSRALTKNGAEILFYPTAIGSEPQDPELDTKSPWQRAMQGQAVSNVIPIVAANRIGHEKLTPKGQHYYGHSFIADHRGELVTELDDKSEDVILARFDLDFLDIHRASWGFFRDLAPNEAS